MQRIVAVKAMMKELGSDLDMLDHLFHQALLERKSSKQIQMVTTREQDHKEEQQQLEDDETTRTSGATSTNLAL